jgi:hypothetical protein
MSSSLNFSNFDLAASVTLLLWISFIFRLLLYADMCSSSYAPCANYAVRMFGSQNSHCLLTNQAKRREVCSFMTFLLLFFCCIQSCIKMVPHPAFICFSITFCIESHSWPVCNKTGYVSATRDVPHMFHIINIL